MESELITSHTVYPLVFAFSSLSSSQGLKNKIEFFSYRTSDREMLPGRLLVSTFFKPCSFLFRESSVLPTLFFTVHFQVLIPL